MTKFPETPVFVPNGDDQTETAVLLVGTAAEHGLPKRSIRSTTQGFWISEALADLVYPEGEEAEAEVEAEADDTETNDTEADDVFDVAAYGVKEVKAFVEENPETAADVLAIEAEGRNRPSLVKWLNEFLSNNTDASGDRAVKNNTATDKE